MTAVYENHGVKFAYPENWKLFEESEHWPREVCVESPSGAQWALHLYEPPRDLKDLIQGALKAIEGEYDQVEAEYVQEPLGSAVAEGCNMTFFYLDLLVICQARCFTWGNKTLLLMAQAEDRDFQELDAVFRAMTFSLLQSLDAGPSPPP
jgi:hypothetical protein